MSQTKPPGGTGVTVFLALTFLAGAYVVYAALGGLVALRVLSSTGQRVSARVTDSRIMHSRKRGDSFEVRYEFEIGGRAYTYGDSTGRTDLYASLTEPAYRAARSAGTVEVVYAPGDPSRSRAVEAAGEPIFASMAGAVAGLFLMLPGALAIVGAIRGRRPSTRT